MKKVLRKQIKQDEFVSGLERGMRFVRAHQRQVSLAVAAVIALAVASWSVSAWRERRESRAVADLAAALEIFNAPVASELPAGAPPPAGTLYPSATDKFKKAAAAFDGVERAYGSLPLALRARYYGAIARMQAGDNQAAEGLLTEIAAIKDPERLEPALARLALAELFERTGREEKAVETYRQAADDASSPLPRDYALMGLASALEEAHRVPEARASYERVADEFPNGVYAAEARRRADYLATAGG